MMFVSILADLAEWQLYLCHHDSVRDGSTETSYADFPCIAMDSILEWSDPRVTQVCASPASRCGTIL